MNVAKIIVMNMVFLGIIEKLKQPIPFKHPLINTGGAIWGGMTFFRAPFFFLVAGDLRCSEASSTLKTRCGTCVYPRIYVPLRNPPTETQQFCCRLKKHWHSYTMSTAGLKKPRTCAREIADAELIQV